MGLSRHRLQWLAVKSDGISNWEEIALRLPFTTTVSSPGNILNCSPTCKTPLHSLPDTAVPEVRPLNTLEIGNRSGEVIALAGGSSLSDGCLVFHIRHTKLK